MSDLFTKHPGETDQEYLQRKLAEYRQRVAEAPLRPRQPQDGHADLPLFQVSMPLE